MIRLLLVLVALFGLSVACETEPTRTPTSEPTPSPVRDLTAQTVYDALLIDLRWEHAPGPAHTYVIQAAESESGPWEEIARVPAAEGTSYSDGSGASGRTLEDGRTYWYRVVTEIEDGTQSKPSAIVSAVAVDLPRPTATPTRS